MTDTSHIEVLRKVIHWAESRCPCKEETPDPCTLCGATVAEGTCKAVESIFPRDLLRDLRNALSARASAGEGGVGWPNGSDKTVPAALRYLAEHERPIGGEQRYNSAHLYQLAGEVERMASRLATAAPQPAQAGASGGGVDEKHLADCLLMTGHLGREQAEEVASKLRAFVFTPASPATGEECKCALCDALNATPESRRRVHELIAKHPELFPHTTPPAHGDGEGDAIAPWPDFAGNQIRDRDRIRHPDGTTGTVLRLVDLAEGAEGEAWRVVYGGGDMSRLSLQIGDKGQAVVVTTRPTPEAQEARDAADARRYRWLRSLPTGPGTSTIGDFHFTLAQHRPAPNRWCVDSVRGDSLDAAIDAALALPAQGEGKNG